MAHGRRDDYDHDTSRRSRDSKTRKKESDHWMQHAVKKEGSFTAQANRAKMSVPAFTNEVLSDPTKFSMTTRRRANLAKTFAKNRP